MDGAISIAILAVQKEAQIYPDFSQCYQAILVLDNRTFVYLKLDLPQNMMNLALSKL